jgi:hypothetical protein
MKKTLYSIFILFILTLTLINIFDHSTDINSVILESFDLFAKAIFPSLFPMFIISNILINIGIPNFLGSLFQNIFNKLFKVKGITSFIFFMSLITGFPSSSKYINDLIDKGLINEFDANKILTFTFFANPLFIVNTVGIIFLNNKRIGYLILLSLIIGNIIIGLIFRNYNKTNEINNHKNIKTILKELNKDISTTNIFKTILNAVTDSLNALVFIFGIITFFLIITNLINNHFNINPITNTLITGLLEMTSGIKNLAKLDFNINIKAIISVIFMSFGGLSVHAQVMNILKEKKVKYLPFFISRIIHTIISTIILYLFLLI